MGGSQEAADALHAVVECLRHLAHSCEPLAIERKACQQLLGQPIAGTSAADLDTARKIIGQAGRRRLAARTRERASKLSLQLSAIAESLRSRS